MKIGIDIDDTINNASSFWIPTVNKKFHLNLKEADITNYFLENVITHVKPQQIIDFINSQIYLDEFHAQVQPAPFSLSVIKKLKQHCWSIYYISFRAGEIKAKTKDWLKKYGFLKYSSGLCHSELYHSQNQRSKFTVAQKLKLDYFVDDQKENILEIAQIPTITCFLLNKPWNQGKLPSNIIRIKNWREIDDYLLKNNLFFQ